MNFIRELIEGSHLFIHGTGRSPQRVMVPRWRHGELVNAFHEMFPHQCPNANPDPCHCEFYVAGLCGIWWDRDYIEYQL